MKTETQAVVGPALPCAVCGARLYPLHIDARPEGARCCFCGSLQPQTAAERATTLSPTSEGTRPDLDVLRRARQERGETLAQASRFTNIRLEYLRGLEEGDTATLELFPGHVYLRFFLREYAEHLGLEARPLLRQFDLETTGSALVPARAPRLRPPRPMRWAVGAAFVLIALLVGSTVFSSRDRDAPTAPIATSSPHRYARADVTRPPQRAARVESIDISLSVTASCWVRAIVDGRTTLEDTLAPGKTVHLHATHTIDLRLGNAGAATLILNGRPIRAGGSGDVVDLSFALRAGRVRVT